MRFEIIPSEGHDSYILKDTRSGTFVEILTFGALLNQFATRTQSGETINVIDGFTGVQDAKQNITNGFHSAKLSPFVCRLHKGQYSFEGKDYKIDKFYMGDSAIHGLLYDAPFKVSATHVDEHKATLSLIYTYRDSSQGFPFAFDIEVLYKLGEKGDLQLTTHVTNAGTGNMPISDGWHPYFTLGATINTAAVRFDSKELVEFDEALLPNGKTSLYNSFNQFKIFGDTELDNCFTLNREKYEGDLPAFEIKDEAAGIQLGIYPDDSYPYLQIYTPPSRTSIAVENLSSVPDAFNNKTGLITLSRGEARTFSTTYKLTTL
ncbi:aldose 1-epimerase [Arachidicoccus rhizosphaerae]|jgi:aldose 1-epimerase|uniref:Aldose 1-epimerase n=1 Tax=Arachidicoccus rhizosphaerae TaxID=551991 RepID=A0A1H3VNG8_9BACT|nr:aldose 1-epimerase [Arachidicoccus rhizosphaerae]SDZ75804.1 aldose 1-epimerase [Arachidicoccus rhizosphaerae]